MTSYTAIRLAEKAADAFPIETLHRISQVLNDERSKSTRIVAAIQKGAVMDLRTGNFIQPFRL
jgi:hypothetical protein